jgi:hypothetical protein
MGFFILHGVAIFTIGIYKIVKLEGNEFMNQLNIKVKDLKIAEKVTQFASICP